jgi:lysophospholipase L1-like esterase
MSFGAATAVVCSSSFGIPVFGFDGDAKTRPFEMLVLGDSIMWGQGLGDEFKFYYLLKKWLEGNEVFAGKRDVRPTVEAHSGANIFPEKDPKRSLMKGRDGEINVSNPPILFQVESALEKYGKYPEYSASAQSVGNNVDLILLDGGANDFSMRQILLSGEKDLNDADIKKYAEDYCKYGMTTLLRVVCSTFPSARVVVTGYYPLVSLKTDKDVLSRTIFGALGINATYNAPFHKDGERRDRWAARSDAWVKYSNESLEAAVKTANRAYPPSSTMNGPRVLFVPIRFKPENAYGTFKDPNKSESFLWYTGKHLVTGDDRFNDRRERICVSADTNDMSKLDKKICMRAATFHPNHEGANFYYEQIKAALLPYVDGFKSPTP